MKSSKAKIHRVLTIGLALIFQSAQASDPYEVLGVDPGASRKEIVSKYKKLVLQYHPDRLPEGAGPAQVREAGEKFREITEAFELLTEGRKGGQDFGPGFKERVFGLFNELFPEKTEITTELLDQALKHRLSSNPKLLAEILVLDFGKEVFFGQVPRSTQVRIEKIQDLMLKRMLAHRPLPASQSIQTLEFDRVVAAALLSDDDRVPKKALGIARKLNLNSRPIMDALFEMFAAGGGGILPAPMFLTWYKDLELDRFMAKRLVRSDMNDADREKFVGLLLRKDTARDPEIGRTLLPLLSKSDHPRTRLLIARVALEKGFLVEEAVKLTLELLRTAKTESDIPLMLIEGLLSREEVMKRSDVRSATQSALKKILMSTGESYHGRTKAAYLAIREARKSPGWKELSTLGESYLRSWLASDLTSVHLDIIIGLLKEKILEGPTIQAFIKLIKNPDRSDYWLDLGNLSLYAGELKALDRPPPEIVFYLEEIAGKLQEPGEQAKIRTILDELYEAHPKLQAQVSRIRSRLEGSNCLTNLLQYLNSAPPAGS